MKIGIIGNGVVGNATAKALASHVEEVRIYDREKAKSSHDLISTLESDLVLICLPTPQEKGFLDCDVSAITSFFTYGVPNRLNGANFVLRSTVPVGYTRELAKCFKLSNLVHSPEFLT